MYLYPDGHLDIYFALWVEIQYKYYLFCCSDCFSFVYWQFFHLTPMSFPHVLILFIFKALSYFLGTTKFSSSSCTFPVSAQDQPLLQGTVVLFRGEWYLETKIWMLGMLIATGLSLLLDPLGRQ